jgi:hypothetical protein
MSTRKQSIDRLADWLENTYPTDEYGCVTIHLLSICELVASWREPRLQNITVMGRRSADA